MREFGAAQKWTKLALEALKLLKYGADNYIPVGSYVSMVSLSSEILDTSLSIMETAPLQFGGFLELAVLFFILAIVAAVVGASGVAGISMTIAKWFVIIFVVLAVISLVL